MFILIIKCELSLPWAHSLKAKRQVLRSLIDKLRRHYNISVTEVADHDVWQKASLGLAYISAQESQSWEMADKLQNFIDEQSEADANFTKVIVSSLSDLV